MSADLLVEIWKSQPGRFFCISTKSKSGKWNDHFFSRAKLKRVADYIAANLDKDVYFCPHGFSSPRRLKKFAEPAKLLWADLDEANPRDFDHFMPTVAWESSPGRYAALWTIDEFMSEELNRRLTYHLHADPSGWDLTQVLRVPGTRNYKYATTPPVKLLWADGPDYRARELTRMLPREVKRREADKARAIYLKYERKFNGFIRRELLRGKPRKGMRSDVLWKLVHELIEAGCSRDEAFELLRVSPWNKFAKRRDGDEQLNREINKALEQHFMVRDDEDPGRIVLGEDGGEEDDEEAYTFLARSMADVEIEEMDWVWYPYLARGEVTILEGDPGLGKSYLAQMVALSVCDGIALPSPKRRKLKRGRVAYFDIENASGAVTKKRLVENGIRHLENFFQEEEPFAVDDEEMMDSVFVALEKLRPALVVFDTVNTYMGLTDTHKASETTAIFKRFVQIARRFGCAVLVLRHLTKSTKEKALYRGQGSIAFAGVARFILTMGTLPEDDDVRVVAMSKINVARAPQALTFTIEALPDTLQRTDRSRFVWGDYVDLKADDIVTPQKKKTSNGENLEACAEWLKGVMKDEGGVMDEIKLRDEGERRAWPWKLIERAAAEVGVERLRLKRGVAVWQYGAASADDGEGEPAPRGTKRRRAQA